eukprot:1532582-Pyramimonas_sp.AAC.1
MAPVKRKPCRGPCERALPRRSFSAWAWTHSHRCKRRAKLRLRETQELFSSSANQRSGAAALHKTFAFWSFFRRLGTILGFPLKPSR